MMYAYLSLLLSSTSLEEWTPGTLSAEELVLGIAKLRWAALPLDGSTVSFQWIFEWDI